MKIEDYGCTANSVNEKYTPARITAVHRERFEIVCDYGKTYARLKTGEYYEGDETYPTTGDFVLIDHVQDGDSRIIKTLPRRTYFSRKDPTPGRGEQAVAANFDYVFIMQSLNQDFNISRLERYLTLAWQSGAQPIVILTKADLPGDHNITIEKVKSIAIGVPIHAVSSKSGVGLEALSTYFTSGKTIVFLGSSGVGKSSLVNSLAGENIMSVNSIREDDGKGRHTTTRRQLIMLKNGAMIIDTPGMRELGIWNVTDGLEEAFSDIDKFIGKCRFSDCTHEHEPGCAVQSALMSGELSHRRWNSYRELRLEASLADEKAEFLKNKWERNKAISRKSKQMKKEGLIRK